MLFHESSIKVEIPPPAHYRMSQQVKAGITYRYHMLTQLPKECCSCCRAGQHRGEHDSVENYALEINATVRCYRGYDRSLRRRDPSTKGLSIYLQRETLQ